MTAETVEMPASAAPKARGRGFRKAAEKPEKPAPVALPKVKPFLPPEEFFTYWRAIPKDLRDERVIVWVYRILPLIDNTQTLSEQEKQEIKDKKRQKPTTNLGKFVDPDEWDPKKFAQHCAELWGAGDYSFRLNDTHPASKGTKTTAITSGEFPLREWDAFPPMMDPRHVVLTEKRNEQYIRWARIKGIKLFGDPAEEAVLKEQEEEQEVANVAAIEKLTDALVESTREKNKPAAPAPASDAAQTGAAVFGILEKAASASQKMLTDAQERASAVAAQNGNGIEMTKSLVELARLLNPPTDPHSNILLEMLKAEQARSTAAIQLERDRAKSDGERQDKMYQLLLQQQEQRLAALAKEVADLRAAPHPPAPGAPPAGQPAPVETTFEKALDGLLRIKGKLDNVMGGDSKGDMPWWGTLIQEGLPEVLNAASNITHNIAVARTGQGQPVKPSELVEAQGAEPEVVEDPMEIQILKSLHPVILQGLRAGRPGWELGGIIMEDPQRGGEQLYNFLCAKGAAGITSLLQMYAPLWAELMHPSVGPDKTAKFIDQFLMRKEAAEFARQLSALKASRGARVPKANGSPAKGEGQSSAAGEAPQHPGPVVTPKQ